MKRIYIVDDEENIGRSLRLILEREGYAVNYFRNARRVPRGSPKPPAATLTSWM